MTAAVLLGPNLVFRAYAGGIAIGLWVTAVPVRAEEKAFVDASVGATAASNPFLDFGSDTSSVGISAEIEPVFLSKDQLQTLELRANVRATQYLRRYDSDLAGSLRVSAERRLSPSATIRGAGSFYSSRTGLRDILRTGLVTEGVTQSPTTPLPDISFVGQRTRTTVLHAEGGADLRISPRETLGLNAGTTLTKFKRRAQSDYRYSVVGLSYLRTLSPQTSVGTYVQVAESAYLNQRSGDGVIVTGQLRLRHQINPTLSLNASGGLSHARIARAGEGHRSFISLSGDVQLCDQRDDRAICFHASRSTQPTAFGGVSALTNVALDYSNRLSRRDELTVGARYARTSEATEESGRADRTLFGGVATLARKFDQRLSAFVSPTVEVLTDEGAENRENFQINVGLRYRFGAVR